MEFVQQIDFAILNFIREYFTCGFLDATLPVITKLGNSGIFWIILALVLLVFKRYRKTGVKMAIALILMLIVCNIILKPTVARIRPYDINTGISLLVERLSDFSFPSGHAMAGFAAAFCAVFAKIKHIWIPSVILASIIAFSRLYLYVHYPTDVIAGIVLGIGLAYLSHKLVDFIDKKVKESAKAKE